MKPTFSILTACCNNAIHLNDCINSVMKQTFTDFEWIVIDDCSDDNSYSVLEGISDPRVKVVRNKDRLHCSSTYAKALSMASGKYFGVLDADDALSKRAVAKILECYNRYPHLLYIYTQHFWCNENLVPQRNGISRLPKNGMSLVESSKKRRQHCYSHWRTARTSVRDMGTIFPENLKWAVDKNMGYALERLGCGGFYDKKLYYYRYHKKNMSLRHGGDQKQSWANLIRQYSNSKEKTHNIIQVRI